MPFTGQSVMDRRLGFVAACLKQEASIGDLCSQYGISRKTGYKWLSRYQERGALGLVEQSRAPKTMPWRISAETEAAILGLRERFATWGPRTLLARLALDGPQGKEKMVVRIALAHKLLVRLNAKARETRAAIAQTA